MKKLKSKKGLSTFDAFIIGQEKENYKLGQDLHNGITGNLTAMRLNLSILNKEKNCSKNSAQTINNVVNNLDKTIEELRNLTHKLSAPILAKESLIDYLESYCKKKASQNDINIIFQCLGSKPIFSTTDKILIFKIIQELLTNSIAHSNADNIIVQVSNYENNCTIIIEDDGNGFNSNEPTKGIGLQNIKYMTKVLKCTFNINTDENGATFTITITNKNT